VNPKPGVSLGVLHTTSQCFIYGCPGEIGTNCRNHLRKYVPLLECLCKGSQCHLSSAPNLAMGSMKEGG
jgi:hypothetical protein